jgi:predicted ATPase
VTNRTQAATRARSLGLLDRAPATRQAASNNTLPRHNLPAQVTSFVGRQREIEEIASLLLETSRLLSLIGPAGCGKTRLALKVATGVLPYFRDGVYFVPLAPVRGKERILWTIAEHLTLQFYPHGRPLDQLLKYLHEKSLLLVLDNFEHLLDGAEILIDILKAAPGVNILVTSRERLNVYGEATYIVGGLRVPEKGVSDNAIKTESVELFVQRAQLINRRLKPNDVDLHNIARICSLVGGLPLGIELTATWVNVLTLKEIGDAIEHSLDILDATLRGTPSQNSLRTAFARSWNLLDEMQQIGFRRLAVFRGSFTRKAMEEVTGQGWRVLQALVNKSLLNYSSDSGRYELHELLRQYAQEQLDSPGEAADVYERHASYYAHFMAEHWPQMKGYRQQAALLEIEAEFENILAAWDYWFKKKNIAQLKQFLHSLWVLYDIRGWYRAGIELFDRAAAMIREVQTDEAQAVLGWLLAVHGLYNVVGGMYRNAGGTSHGFALAQEGLQIFDRVEGYDDLRLVPLISMFVTASLFNATDVAIVAAQKCLDVASRINDAWAVGKAKQFLTITAIGKGEYADAERLAHEALAISRSAAISGPRAFCALKY